jgi:hypothetical protein
MFFVDIQILKKIRYSYQDFFPLEGVEARNATAM